MFSFRKMFSYERKWQFKQINPFHYLIFYKGSHVGEIYQGYHLWKVLAGSKELTCVRNLWLAKFLFIYAWYTGRITL